MFTLPEGCHCPENVRKIKSVVVGSDEYGGGQRGENPANDSIEYFAIVLHYYINYKQLYCLSIQLRLKRSIWPKQIIKRINISAFIILELKLLF